MYEQELKIHIANVICSISNNIARNGRKFNYGYKKFFRE